jgi:hypothetical protein
VTDMTLEASGHLLETWTGAGSTVTLAQSFSDCSLFLGMCEALGKK